MKSTRLAVAAAASLAIVAGGVCVAAWRVDAGSVRDEIRARLEQAGAARVELGDARLVLLPLPAVVVRGVRVEVAPALRIDAPELRVDVSLFDLLRGRVAPTRVRTRGAALALGALRLEQVAWSGALAGVSDRTFEFSARSPVLGPIERGRLSLGATSGPIGDWPWSASAELTAVELARAGELLALRDLRGGAQGRFEAAGRGGDADRASLELASADLALAGGQYRVSGAISLSTDLAGSVALDLTGASVRAGAGFEKPAGVALRVSGKRSPREATPRLRELRVEADGLHVAGELDLTAETLDLHAGSLDLAALSSWALPDWVPRSGRVEIASAHLAGRPLEVYASGDLVDVRVPLPLAEHVLAGMSGRVDTDGRQIRSPSLRVAIGGEQIEVAGHYDWVEPRIEVAVSARGAELGALAEALWGRTDLSGRLYARVDLSGPPDPLALEGSGDVELAGGELPGLSLARAAGLAIPDGEETEPPELDRFDALAVRFDVAGDRLDVREATLAAPYTTAALSGHYYLRDLAADLTGAVQFEPPLVPTAAMRPILRMAGPLDALATHISDAQTDDVRHMEAAMIEAIRKVEAERRAAGKS